MTTKSALFYTIVAATLDASRGFLAIEPSEDAHNLVNEGLIEVNSAIPGLPQNHAAARATPNGLTYAEANPQGGTQTQATNWGSTQGETNTGPATNFGDAAAQASQTQTSTAASTSPAFIRVSGEGFAPQAPVKREGAVRNTPEKYDFGSLKAPTKRPDGSIDYTGAVLFVPSTKDKTGKLRTGDEMAFSLLSACSAAARRYDTELPPKVGSDGKSRKQYAKTGPSFKTQAGTENGVVGAYIYREFKEQAAA